MLSSGVALTPQSLPACLVQPMPCDYAMSRRLGSGSRSARKGSRDRNASGAWRLAALASLVFRSALTPEHAEGRWTGDGPFFEAPASDGACLSVEDPRGARHWGASSRRTLVFGRS